MLSPVQRWLAEPKNARWEQPSFSALRELCTTSAPLRKKQAVQLWEADVLSMCQQISALSWAGMYARIAKALVYAPQTNALLTRNNCLANEWLRVVAAFPSYVKKDDQRQRAGRDAMPLLRQLGHEHPLSRAFVECVWLGNEQIEYWRQTFCEEPMHQKMQMALDIQLVRNNTLNGYLRARKSLLTPQVYDNVDLSILGEDL